MPRKDNSMLNDDNDKPLLEEQWKPVKNYEGVYWVSDRGRVKNNRKVMKPHKNNSGYWCICFSVNCIKSHFLVHRLIALHFHDNCNGYPEVNHIDENKDNNHANNLEWCSRSYNKQHSIATGTYDKIYTQKNTLGKKHKKTCKSKYHNVTWDKNRERWQASIRHEGKTLHQKRFKDEKDAARHVNWIIDHLGLIDRPRNIID